MTGTMLLVRHGETEWNRARRYQGWLDSPLTPEGIAQAEAIGRRLRLMPEAASAEIIASPLGRARHTAAIIAECLSDGRGHRGRSASTSGCARSRSAPGTGSTSARSGAAPRTSSPAKTAAGSGISAAPTARPTTPSPGASPPFSPISAPAPVIAVSHGVVTRVLRGLYAGIKREEALRLAVPQDRIFRLAQGAIAEIPA